MNILCLGNSSIGRRKAFPAMASLDEVKAIDIASRSRSDQIAETAPAKFRNAFGDYSKAIAESDAELVYISTTNETHYELAKKVLTAGKHLVVEKPLTMDLEQTKELIALSKDKQCFLGEAVVFCFHPQFGIIRNELTRFPQGKEEIELQFLIPDFPEDNYRYDPTRGGGILWDMGVYATSIPRVLHPQIVDQMWEPSHLSVDVEYRNDVDIKFNLRMEYENGISLQGRFGYGEVYQNHGVIRRNRCELNVDRIFAKPVDQETTIKCKDESGEQEIAVTCGDVFENFFSETLAAIHNGEIDRFHNTILFDAKNVALLRRKATEA